MPKLVCSGCGAEYPANWRAAWGRHHATHGLGPVMVCGELVPNGLIAPLPDNMSEEQCPPEKRVAHQICGAPLMPASGNPADGRPTWPA